VVTASRYLSGGSRKSKKKYAGATQETRTPRRRRGGSYKNSQRCLGPLRKKAREGGNCQGYGSAFSPPAGYEILFKNQQTTKENDLQGKKNRRRVRRLSLVRRGQASSARDIKIVEDEGQAPSL